MLRLVTPRRLLAGRHWRSREARTALAHRTHQPFYHVAGDRFDAGFTRCVPLSEVFEHKA